jgi:hypothetical protein
VLSISYCNYSNPCWIQGIKNWIQGLDYNTIRVRDQSEKNLRIRGSKCKEWKGFFQTFVSKHLVERMIFNKYMVETLTEIQFYNKKILYKRIYVTTQIFQTQKNKFKVL